MPPAYCLTVRFLDPCPAFRGRRDGEAPEWPPSPLRLFQALVAAAAQRWREPQFQAYAGPALKWLETQAPTIIAPKVQAERSLFRMYVPNNAADLVTGAWARGATEASIASHRVEKDVRPTRMTDGDCVRYLWDLPEPLPAPVTAHLEVISAAARSITHLGWGVDMATGNGAIITDEEATALPGERWEPSDDQSADGLRTPVEGTLDALVSKHAAFLKRLAADHFQPVPPLTAFRVQAYRRTTDPTPKPWAAFGILNPNADGNQSFDTARRCRDVAAWVRHVVGETCERWPFGDTAGFVHGHDAVGGQIKGTTADHRFMYLPLPTIIASKEINRVTTIQRVLITAPPAFKNRVDWVRRRLLGQDLVSPEGEVIGLLNILPDSDWVLRQYTGQSTTWHTVTPVVLPGHDDRDSKKAGALLRKAFVQAGMSQELADGIRDQDLDWRQVGFKAGLDLASRYIRPETLKGPIYHVRVRFQHPVQGPLAVGAGRYRGFGLFACERDT